MYLEKTSNGIEYAWELADSAGANFMLYPAKGQTRKMVKEAIAELRRERDVVRITVARDADWNDRYRHEIFADPQVRHLRWFEVNADTTSVIRYHRLKGTPVDEYIRRFVLPCVCETKARNIQRFGKSILDR